MEFFRIHKDIPFMRHALKFNIISLVTFILAVLFLLTKGLHLSVEFTGGTLIEVKYEQAADLEKIRGALGKSGFSDYSVQNFGSSQDVMIRLPLKGDQNTAQLGDLVMKSLNTEAPGAALSRVEFVGPQVGKELAENGAMALFLVILGIVIYLAFRFEWRFSVSAIIANLHDVVIILGFFAFFQWEFSLPVLAAVLAVLGLSYQFYLKEKFQQTGDAEGIATGREARYGPANARQLFPHGTAHDGGAEGREHDGIAAALVQLGRQPLLPHLSQAALLVHDGVGDGDLGLHEAPALASSSTPSSRTGTGSVMVISYTRSRALPRRRQMALALRWPVFPRLAHRSSDQRRPPSSDHRRQTCGSITRVSGSASPTGGTVRVTLGSTLPISASN